MATIDLTAPAPQQEGTLEALPRRISLTLPELQLLADRAGGGAPLPFELSQPGPSDALSDRLGQSPAGGEDEAYVAAVGSLHDPAESLARRGLLGDDGPDAGVVGALGLLATPRVAVDIEVVVNGLHAKAWHRQSDEAVATLATSDGIVFELAWFEAPAWPTELARVAVVPEDVELAKSAVPTSVDLPFGLLEASGEAVRSHRTDLVPVVVSSHGGQSYDEAGEALDAGTVGTVVTALGNETHGRLRALVADVSRSGAPVVGVVSWVLVNDGWRSLTGHRVGDERRVAVRSVEPADLAPTLAPVLAEVTR
ncbi:hypothetical protein [Nocardioides speluncae]|uniref:hypothetical protein n=1 Tax=Nocardioides speluncae TaxID=2670337 RepID=UPI000D68CB9C|nr:hypothetical protein [Nocardioides speluncae]